jgi:hypothetical protein
MQGAQGRVSVIGQSVLKGELDPEKTKDEQKRN